MHGLPQDLSKCSLPCHTAPAASSLVAEHGESKETSQKDEKMSEHSFDKEVLKIAEAKGCPKALIAKGVKACGHIPEKAVFYSCVEDICSEGKKNKIQKKKKKEGKKKEKKEEEKKVPTH